MPQLLMFAPARKIIHDATEEVVSLVAIFDVFNIQILPGDIPPVDAVAPFTWDLYVHWGIAEGEQGITFEHRVVIAFADGQEEELLYAPFTPEERTHRVHASYQMFPVGHAGQHYLILSLRQATLEDEWIEVAHYPISVNYLASASPGFLKEPSRLEQIPSGVAV